MTIGIYKITNIKTGQMYIGQSSSIEKRWKNHISKLRSNKHHNEFLQNSWNKYGEKNFNFSIIETFPKDTPFLNDVLNDSEEYFIQAYNTFLDKKHYNLNKGGEFWARGELNPMYGVRRFGRENPMFGTKHSKDSRTKISKAKNSTGFYRVSKKRKKQTKYGFFYSYEYYIGKNKRKTINSIDLEDLKKRVINNNLEWFIIDEENAKKTLDIERNKVIK